MVCLTYKNQIFLFFIVKNSEFYHWEHLNSCVRSDQKPVWSCILSLTVGKSRCLEKKWKRMTSILWNFPEPSSCTFRKLLEVGVLSPFLTDSSDIFYIFFQCFLEYIQAVMSHCLSHWLLLPLIFNIVWKFEPVSLWFCLIADSSRAEWNAVSTLHHFLIYGCDHTSLISVSLKPC